MRDTAPRQPSAHPRLVSTNQPATAWRRRPRPPAEWPVPAEAPPAVLQSCSARVESLLRLARIRARFQANLPEMSRKAVAQEVPSLGYRCSEHIETPKSGLREPLFRGA